VSSERLVQLIDTIFGLAWIGWVAGYWIGARRRRRPGATGWASCRRWHRLNRLALLIGVGLLAVGLVEVLGIGPKWGLSVLTWAGAAYCLTAGLMWERLRPAPDGGVAASEQGVG